MKIVFLINQTHKEEDNCTTSLLAFKALQRGHTIWYIGVADFSKGIDGGISAYARIIEPHVSVANNLAMVDYLRNQEKIYASLADIDILWVRFDPTADQANRPWAPAMGLQFASRVKKMGKLVINDPESLAFYSNKLYLEDFPERFRPPSIVTRRYEEVLEFMQRYPAIVIKPLQGSTGKNVFFVDRDHLINLRQTVEVLAQEGYFVVQEYLPEARNGDIRLYLLDGRPIQIDESFAILKRIPAEDDIRSNIHQGGIGTAADITIDMWKIIDTISQKIIADGMYFVGLDIVGSKLLEINVNSAGGLAKTNEVQQKDFTTPIIIHLEEKYNDFMQKNKNSI
ncbi:ATP-grasp domain-containing protein [Sphingobacterium pedocola]|uniref:Glutathione synthetase n=1 Tax=Sphingobacterium pedocola TaxID=2082722 RepID=A0ABR9TB17_9SPHI|nr:glutathione synthase [Sphingobacterium pedocola]MBE8722470.1 glutathione synthetase [Sphingobacterium pedocola]